MFEKIDFHTRTTNIHLVSTNISEKDLENPKYDSENLLNSKFSIIGSVESFPKPPITSFAKQNLYYMQDFSIFHYGEGSYTERKNFESFLILYTYEGHGQLTYQDKTYTLKKGDGFFINCKDYHLYKVVGKEWHTAILHLGGSLLPSIHKDFMSKGNPLFHESLEQPFQNQLEALLNLYNFPVIYRDWQVSSCISNILTHLLILTGYANSDEITVPKSVRTVMAYIEKNFTEPINLDLLSSLVNMNKFYLAKEFKRYTGFTPHNYLISCRINQAKILLHVTTLPATKIGHEVGIHDSNNFTNLFKKRTGMTPIQFRKANVQYY